MEENNHLFWNDESLIKPRCLKCFILFPKILRAKPDYFSDSGIKYYLSCDYCKFKENIDLCEYLKFVKSNNIQIPLCSQCEQNPSTLIQERKFTYICDNCFNHITRERHYYKRLKNNFNSYYCKEHNKSFKFINDGEPFCKKCYSLLETHTNYGPLSHSYPVVYQNVTKNLEKLKKDKIYIENLVSDIQNKYHGKEEIKTNKKDENEDEFSFSDFNEYYNQEFLVKINTLIEFIEILLPNYSPKIYNENLSTTLELFIYYKKISEFNFKEFDKNESKWYYLYEYLYDYSNPFEIKSTKLDFKKICNNSLKFERGEKKKMDQIKVLKDGRIAGIMRNKIAIFDIEKTNNNKIKFDILYEFEEDEYMNFFIELNNGNLLINKNIYKIDKYTLIKIKELDIDNLNTREIIRLTKNRIAMSIGSWGYSVIIYDENNFSEIKTLPTKDYPNSICQLLDKEIIALSIMHESDIEFWSLVDYNIIFQIKNIYPGYILNYKKDKIISSSFDDYAFYIIDTKLFKVENIFKISQYFDWFNPGKLIINEFLFIDNMIILLDNDIENNRFFELIKYHKHSDRNYFYLLKDDNILIYNSNENELYSIKKTELKNKLNNLLLSK